MKVHIFCSPPNNTDKFSVKSDVAKSSYLPSTTTSQMFKWWELKPLEKWVCDLMSLIIKRNFFFSKNNNLKCRQIVFNLILFLHFSGHCPQPPRTNLQRILSSLGLPHCSYCLQIQRDQGEGRSSYRKGN